MLKFSKEEYEEYKKYLSEMPTPKKKVEEENSEQ
jgi:hypothetical protein